MPNTLEDLHKFVTASEAAGKRVYFTSRSAIVARQRCPRSRWLHYHYGGRGLSKIRLNVPQATGTYTHLGARLLLTGHSPEETAGQVLAAYDAEVIKRGMDLESTESQQFVAEEQRAICEAFVWLMHLRVIPELKRDYEIVEVEQEDWFLLYEDSQMVIVVETRADAVMRERVHALAAPGGEPEQGDLYILSWKTAKTWDKRKLRDARVDMQGTTEAYSTELRLAEPVMGTKMVHLLKGRRFEDDYNPGTYITRSPLIRPWAQQTGPVPEFAWSFEWSNSQELNDKGRPVKHRLGKGWRPTFIPEVMPMREWIEMLHENRVQPEAGDCLQKQYVTPMPECRPQHKKFSWLRQTTAREVELAQSLVQIESVVKDGSVEQLDEAIDLMFEQYTHSCTYPSECDMFAICHGSEDAQQEAELTGEEVVNPLSLYQPRDPHHVGEMAQMEDD
jgi:hypothetical protein